MKTIWIYENSLKGKGGKVDSHLNVGGGEGGCGDSGDSGVGASSIVCSGC